MLLRGLALVTQLGFTVAAGAAVGGLAGYGLDRWLSTRPAFVIAGVLLGLAGGLLSAYRMVMGFIRE